MNKQEIVAELLYIGFVAEKGRCYNRMWQINYRKTIRKHIKIMAKLNDVLNDIADFDCVLNELFFACRHNKEIGKFYNFTVDINKIKLEDKYINYPQVNGLMQDLINDLDKEVNKVFVNNKKVYYLLCSLHNLPRVYFGRDNKTLCQLGQLSISEEEALEYSYSNMNAKERERYKKYFI